MVRVTVRSGLGLGLGLGGSGRRALWEGGKKRRKAQIDCIPEEEGKKKKKKEEKKEEKTVTLTTPWTGPRGVG